MPKPDDVGVGTAMVVLNEKGQILLGLRKGAHRVGHWSFPGGWLDRPDVETKIAAIRETLEEAGIVVRHAVQHVWVTEDHPEAGFRTVTLYHITRAGQWSGTPKVMEPDKCERWEWFDLNNLPSPLFPGLQGAIDQLPELQVATTQEEQEMLLKVVEEHLAWTDRWLQTAPLEIPTRGKVERDLQTLKGLRKRFLPGGPALGAVDH